MGRLELEFQDETALLTFSNGKKNSLDRDIIFELARLLADLKTNHDVRALVLTTVGNRYFSVGLDVPGLLRLERSEFRRVYTAYNRVCLELYTFPKPTVAALSGHAIGGGFIPALCCDYRLLAKGKSFVALGELKLGVPVPYPANRIVVSLLGSAPARGFMETAGFFSQQEALEMGLVDRVLPGEDLLSLALELAARLGKLPQQAFEITKQGRTGPVVEKILRRLEEKEEAFFTCWFSEESLPLLEAAARKF